MQMTTSNVAHGRARRDQQLALFESRDAAFLARCRALAVLVARDKGEVSINDVRSLMELPRGVSPSVFGAVFRHRKFEAIGYTQAAHPDAHARAVRVYKLKGEK
ncbi:MAG: hypothetical protein EBT15_07020 [Betaproteobacteria bacterium]|nr:hypothetical protein [Betaproteobacteria bacterium]